MKEILKHFLTQDGDVREFATTLAVVDGFTYACDGKWICRAKGEFGEKIEQYPVMSDLPWDKIKPPFFKISQSDIEELRRKHPCTHCDINSKNKPEECDECGGDGEVYFSNSYNDYEITCESCGGEGNTTVFPVNSKHCPICNGTRIDYDFRALNIQDAFIDSGKVEKLLSILPHVEFCMIGTEHGVNNDSMFGFKTTGFEGLIMPMKP